MVHGEDLIGGDGTGGVWRGVECAVIWQWCGGLRWRVGGATTR